MQATIKYEIQKYISHKRKVENYRETIVELLGHDHEESVSTPWSLAQTEIDIFFDKQTKLDFDIAHNPTHCYSQPSPAT